MYAMRAINSEAEILATLGDCQVYSIVKIKFLLKMSQAATCNQRSLVKAMA